MLAALAALAALVLMGVPILTVVTVLAIALLTVLTLLVLIFARTVLSPRPPTSRARRQRAWHHLPGVPLRSVLPGRDDGRPRLPAPRSTSRPLCGPRFPLSWGGPDGAWAFQQPHLPRYGSRCVRIGSTPGLRRRLGGLARLDLRLRGAAPTALGLCLLAAVGGVGSRLVRLGCASATASRLRALSAFGNGFGGSRLAGTRRLFALGLTGSVRALA